MTTFDFVMLHVWPLLDFCFARVWHRKIYNLSAAVPKVESFLIALTLVVITGLLLV